jgi:hypothetical protein
MAPFHVRLDFSVTDVMVMGGTTILSIAVFGIIAFVLLAS